MPVFASVVIGSYDYHLSVLVLGILAASLDLRGPVSAARDRSDPDLHLPIRRRAGLRRLKSHLYRRARCWRESLQRSSTDL
jgi:hypothetical protein